MINFIKGFLKSGANSRVKLYLPPGIIEEKVSKINKRKYFKGHFIVSGRWDLDLIKMTDSGTYNNMKVLYNCSNGYNIDDFEKIYKEKLSKGRPFNHNGTILSDEKKIRWYTNYCIDLFESLKDGYNVSKENSPIGIAITRDGKPVKAYNGRHRLSVAQILNLEEIMVQLQYVHMDYIYNENGFESLNNILVKNGWESI